MNENKSVLTKHVRTDKNALRDVSDVDMTKLDVQPASERPKPKIHDPDNIHWSDVDRVLAWLGEQKNDKGEVVGYDEVGTHSHWRVNDHGSQEPVPESKTNDVLLTGWRVAVGVNAGGEFRRVVVDGMLGPRIVQIKGGKATVGQEWMTEKKVA